MEGNLCKYHIIGISGATCSGKTTLSKRLKEVFTDAVVFNQDEYFWPTDSPNHVIIKEFNHANWELVTSLNVERLLNDVKLYMNSRSNNKSSIIIIEGIVVLNYRPIADLIHQKFYLTLTKEQCWERRRIRAYDPPDPPGYFDKCVWPMYEKHFKEFREQHPDAVFMDGSLLKDAIYESTYNKILEVTKVDAQL